MKALPGLFVMLLFYLFSLFVASIMGFRDGAAFLVAFVIAGILIYSLHLTEEQEKAKIEKKRTKTEEMLLELSANGKNFSPSHQYVTKNGAGFIQIDEERRLIRLGGIQPSGEALSEKTFSADSILGSKVSENGISIFGSDTANTLGMAAVGGIIFGGAGAVVGAIASQNSKKVTDISLSIALDDLTTPFVGLNFISNETAKGSQAHTEALADAQKWAGMVEILVKRGK